MIRELFAFMYNLTMTDKDAQTCLTNFKHHNALAIAPTAPTNTYTTQSNGPTAPINIYTTRSNGSYLQ